MSKQTDAERLLAAAASIVARCERVAKRRKVALSTVSKQVFGGDARVAGKLRGGWRGIKLASLIAADKTLRFLEAER